MTHNQVAYFQANNDYAKHLENARHNKEQERLTGEQIAAQKEYNYLQAVNQAKALAETYRHNREQENISYISQSIQREYNQAQLALANANLLLNSRAQDTKESSLSETMRHNVAQEQESYRHSYAQEQMQSRQNMWTNLLGFGKLVSGFTVGLATGLYKHIQQKSLLSQN